MMRFYGYSVFYLFILSIVIFIPKKVSAQVGGMDAEFAGGGARALAMGGSFIALADDATATEFNPAGLWQLRTPEIAAQSIYTMRNNEYGIVRLNQGELDVFFEEEEDRYFVPSFLSFVYPTQNLTLGISEFTNVYFDRTRVDPVNEILPQSSKGQIYEQARNYTYGFTLARGITDNLTVGGTLRYNTFSFDLETDDPNENRSFDSGAFSANIGLILRVHPQIRLGCVYKSTQNLEGNYGEDHIDTKLPDTLGAGVAYLPNKWWRILLDVDHIWWSKFEPNPDDYFEKENVWRYHLGAEWYVGKIKETGIFLRGGYFYEDSNAFKYTGTNPLTKKLSSNRDPINHYTVGLGLARQQYQLDLGCDFADDSSVDFIASMVCYF
jgi:long-subunit fatty acid transport protein